MKEEGKGTRNKYAKRQIEIRRKEKVSRGEETKADSGENGG